MTQHRYRDEDIPLTQEQREMVAGNLGLIGVAMKRWPVLVRILGRGEAQAIAEDALCVAVKRHDPENSRWSTYAVSYIRGYWLMAVQRKGRQLITVPPDVLERNLDRHGGDRPDGELDREDENQHLRSILPRILSLLSRKQQQVIDLCFYQGKSQVEAGKYLGVTKNAVHEPLVAGLRQLRKILAHLRPHEQETQ
jgi:RNA polymerase sigma factor (sigma-70 family)